MDERIATLAKHRYISLTTYRRDGRAVATPVWFALDADCIIVSTDRESGKAKRIRANGRAAVAPCDARGRTKAEPTPASAHVLAAADEARSLQILTSRYRLLKPLVDVWSRIGTFARRRPRPVEIFLEIRLT